VASDVVIQYPCQMVSIWAAWFSETDLLPKMRGNFDKIHSIKKCFCVWSHSLWLTIQQNEKWS